jgi:hypothetical protein
MALSNSRFAHDHIVYSHFPGRWRKAVFGVCAGFLRGFDNSGVLAISNVPYWSRLMESFFNEALEKDSRGYKTMRPNALRSYLLAALREALEYLRSGGIRR